MRSRQIKSTGAIGSSAIAIVITRRQGPSVAEGRYDRTSSQIADPAWSSMSRAIPSVPFAGPSTLPDGPARPLDSCPAKPGPSSIGIDVHVRLGLTLVKRIQFHLSQITGVPDKTPARAFIIIGIRALSYRELGCISDMSNSDELRHTDNTTLIPPRLPDTLPQVYHRRRPTLGLLILPSVLPFPPTIRRTARMSVLPIEPNLAERARISAINLDDYQLDPVTLPPSPSSPFSMAAYQRMIAETLDSFLTLWDVKPRVEESLLETLSVDELITQLRQVCEDAEDRASNAQEEARQKRKEALEEVV
ncbi:hypothetical protein Tco_1143784 [Tanacetum coccineum]